MDNTVPGRRRRLLGLAAALSLSLLVLTPANAGTNKGKTPNKEKFSAPVAPIPASQLSQTGDHAMGSQIRKHEGHEPSAQAANIDAADIGIQATVRGIDVSSHQGRVNWTHWWNRGKRFVWVKATEGTGYRNPYFGQQYRGSRRRGFVRGAYHFALPNRSSGAAQARFFGRNGGGWRGDGKTLPGALDMEYNPYGAVCYGMSRSAMRRWIRSFSRTYHARWDRWPVIYTSASWWNQCVRGDFSRTNPLWVARYASRPGPLPHGWNGWRVWQHTSSPIDQNVFNGSRSRLTRFAKRHD
jgi:GH25 family lysozyme M1 (1,4-beta-N-acetylmuramidase)